MAGCRPCHHPERVSIDRQIVAGTALRSVSDFTVTHPPHLSLGSLHRHKQHIKAAIAEAVAVRDGEDAKHSSALVRQLEEVVRAARAIVGHASRDGQYATANSALNTIVRCAELLARASGELATPGLGGIHFHSNKTVNITAVQNNDFEIAVLVQEATRNFAPDEIARLKKLAATAQVSAPIPPQP